MRAAGSQNKMGTEVEHTSGTIQTTTTTPSSAASTSGPKTSIFTKKNKLSGSLVPVFRGTKKGDGDLANDDTATQVQRKTKWGPDLTLDTTVRRGRASAYQTRINQISQQLTLGALELEDNEDLLSASELKDGKTSDHQLTTEESELLELERREIIGEILKLNPTYKAPADYKPLLKEAKVPVPIKEYPGYSFIGLVFGPASDTQKRLEKETGAKIRVYGTKAESGVKVEVTPTDGKEIDNAYEDLYVHVSADTYEKIDAAVALIELLVTPVSVNPVSSTTSTAVSDANVNTTHQSQSTPSSNIVHAAMNQGIAQPYAGTLVTPQGQFPQYSQAWFPAGPTQTPAYPESGLITSANSSAPLVGNAVRVSSMPFNPSNMPSLFGTRPVMAANFSPVLQNTSTVPSTPQIPHASQPPYGQQTPPLGQAGGPRNAPVPILQPVANRLSVAGPPHNVRAVVSSSPQSAPPAIFSDKPLPSAGESTRWLPSPVGTAASQGLNNTMSMTPVPSLGLNAMASQNMGFSGAQLASPNNMISPLSGATQSAGPSASQPSHGGFSSVLPSAAFESAPPAIQPSSIGPPQRGMPPAGMCAPSPNAMPGPAPMPFLVQSSASRPQPLPGITNSFSGGSNFDSVNSSSVAVPRPPQPSSNDFTFQPHRPQTAVSQNWPGGRPVLHNMRPPVQAGQPPLAPHSTLSRPLAPNLNPSPVQGFPRPQMGHQLNQPRAQSPMNFAGTPTVPPVPPRHPTLPGHNVVGSAMQPRNFVPPRPNSNLPGPFPPRPGGQMGFHENHLPVAARQQRFAAPQHFGNHAGRPFSSSSGPQQIYDPFSPTSASFNPQMGGNAAKARNESDPEYEDLMASVGVK